MAKVIVKNNMARVVGIGACNAKGKAYGEMRLIPGANTVDADAWKLAKANDKVLAGYVEREEIEEGDSTNDADTLPGKPSEAIKRVKETLDMKKLRGWLEIEKRPAVYDAVAKQIAIIDSREKKTDPAGGATE